MFKRGATFGIVVAIVGGLLVTACGSTAHDGMHSGSTPAADRTVDVQMTALAFTPSTIAVQAGETVKFVFTNKGTVAHDAFIGDTAAQQQHAATMRSGSDGGHDMAHDGGVTVKPGKSGSLTMTFASAGNLEIGCHEPGHYEAGMKAAIAVS